MSNVIQFPKHQRSYEAKLFSVDLSGMNIKIAGELEGFIDVALPNGLGTLIITCDDARLIASTLLSCVADIQKNCLFDSDPLLA